MSRPKNIIEEPFDGILREPPNFTFELAVVESVDTYNRLVDIKWLSKEGGSTGVAVLHSPGSYAMPMTGDNVIIIFDKVERPLVLGLIDPSFGIQIESGYAEEIEPGEIGIYGRLTSNFDFINGQRLRFLQNGDIFLENPLGDGITLRVREKIMEQKCQTIQQETVAGKMINGSVLRSLGSIFTEALPAGFVTNSPIPLVEQGFDLVEPITRIRRERFRIGDIFSDQAIPEVSSLASPLRMVLESVIAGLVQARISFDLAGNIMINSTTGQIQMSSPSIISLFCNILNAAATAINLTSTGALNLTSTLAMSLTSAADMVFNSVAPVVFNTPNLFFGTPPRPAARIGDIVQVVITSGSSAGTWPGTIVGAP